MVYFLAVITLLIFYQFYKVMGRSDFIPEQNEDNLFYDEERVAPNRVQQKAIQKQWGALEKIHGSLIPQLIVNDLLNIFEEVHVAFAKGVLADVKDFLSKTIQDQFKEEMKQRKGYKLHISFLRKPECIIKKVVIDGNENCTIDTEFQSEQLVYIEDKNGTIVDNPHKITETIKNYWTFKKNLANLSSPWMLVEMI